MVAGVKGGSAGGTKDPYLGLDQFGIGLNAGVEGPIEVSYRVLDSAPLGMALMDPSGRFYWANSAMSVLLGRNRGALLATTIEEVLHPDDAATEMAAVAALLRGERESTEHEIRCLRPDGSVVWITASLSLPTGPDGSLLHLGPQRLATIAVQALDITGRKAVEEALADLQAEVQERNAALERSNKDLDDVAAILSHDLSEPLRVIAGHVRLLADRYRGRLDDDADRWIDFAEDGCCRMKALIDAVLAYSRVGRAGPGAEAVDSGVVVANMVRDVAGLIESAGARVSVEGVFPSIRVSPAELGQVFTNLIMNALRHGCSDAQPQIVIRALTDGFDHRFEVQDNGPGIPPRHRERVFQPLKRLNRPTEGSGTGIGLAICRRAVERVGGRIGIDEPPGGGALLWFTIPRSSR